MYKSLVFGDEFWLKVCIYSHTRGVKGATQYFGNIVYVSGTAIQNANSTLDERHPKLNSTAVCCPREVYILCPLHGFIVHTFLGIMKQACLTRVCLSLFCTQNRMSYWNDAITICGSS